MSASSSFPLVNGNVYYTIHTSIYLSSHSMMLIENGQRKKQMAKKATSNINPIIFPHSQRPTTETYIIHLSRTFDSFAERVHAQKAHLRVSFEFIEASKEISCVRSSSSSSNSKSWAKEIKRTMLTSDDIEQIHISSFFLNSHQCETLLISSSASRQSLHHTSIDLYRSICPSPLSIHL